MCVIINSSSCMRAAAMGEAGEAEQQCEIRQLRKKKELGEMNVLLSDCYTLVSMNSLRQVGG